MALSLEEVEKIKEELRNFELPYREDVVKEDGGKIVVDWNKIVEMWNSKDIMYSGTLDRLVELGVLSPKSKGNYTVYTFGIGLNPVSHAFQLFFVREEDAEGYKEAMYSRAWYPVCISKLD